jgi:hypothetical protein
MIKLTTLQPKSKNELVRLIQSPDVRIKSIEILPNIDQDGLTKLKSLKTDPKTSVIILKEF